MNIEFEISKDDKKTKFDLKTNVTQFQCPAAGIYEFTVSVPLDSVKISHSISCVLGADDIISFGPTLEVVGDVISLNTNFQKVTKQNQEIKNG